MTDGENMVHGQNANAGPTDGEQSAAVAPDGGSAAFNQPANVGTPTPAPAPVTASTEAAANPPAPAPAPAEIGPASTSSGERTSIPTPAPAPRDDAHRQMFATIQPDEDVAGMLSRLDLGDRDIDDLVERNRQQGIIFDPKNVRPGTLIYLG